MTDEEMKIFEKFLIEHKDDIDLMCNNRKIKLAEDENIFEEEKKVEKFLMEHGEEFLKLDTQKKTDNNFSDESPFNFIEEENNNK